MDTTEDNQKTTLRARNVRHSSRSRPILVYWRSFAVKSAASEIFDISDLVKPLSARNGVGQDFFIGEFQHAARGDSSRKPRDVNGKVG